MIVHVNPYDTGFDENSHVMRFSSVAREIQTTAYNKMSTPILRGMGALRNVVTPMKIRVPIPVVQKAKAISSPVTPQFVEEDMQIEEGEWIARTESLALTDACSPVDPEDESDTEEDLLVQFLFGEIAELRMKVSRIFG